VISCALCFSLILTTTPQAQQQSPATTAHSPAQSRPLPPYADLPDINALVDEGKKTKPAKSQPPLKPSTLCGHHDRVCQKLKEKKKISRNFTPAQQGSGQMSASAEPQRGGWLQRLGRAVSGAFSDSAGSSFLPATMAKTSFTVSSTTGMMASAPPPPTFTSANQARLDPRYRIGGAGEDLFSGNFHFSLPLVSLPGRNGLDLNLSLHYNSLVWLRYNNTVQFDPDFNDSQNYSSLTPGFRLGLPLIEGPFTHEGYDTYIVILPSGARVGMRYVTTNEYEAIDSSYLYLKFNPAAQTATLYTTDGRQYFYTIPSGDWWYRCTQVKDSNGNFLTIGYTALGSWPDQVYAVSAITDTLGRVITFNYDSYLHLLSITQSWQGQTRYWAQFDYGTQTIQYNFGSLLVEGPTNNTSIPVITRVITGDGARHTFVYNSWGQVEQIWRYGEADNPRQAMIYVFPGTSSAQTDCPRFNQRNDGIYAWAGQTYDPGSGFGWVSTYFYLPADESQGWVTPPNGVTYKEYFNTSTSGGLRGLPYKTETVWNNQLQKYTETTWASDSASGVPVRPRVTDTKVTDDINHNGAYESGTDKRSRTTISYTTLAGTVKLPWIVREYNEGGSTVYRSTKTDYLPTTNYLNLSPPVNVPARRIIGLPSLSRLYQGDVESGGTLVAQTGYIYDSPNDSTTYLQAHAATPSRHDSASYGTGFLYRGNLTKVQRYSVTNGTAGSCPSGCTETKTGYFITGNVALAKDALGHQTSLIYDDSFLHISEPTTGTLSTTTVTPGAPTFAYPTRVMDPDGFSSTLAYNYDFGAVTRAVDPKEYALHGASPTTMTVSTYDPKGRPDKALVWKDGAKYAQSRYAYGTDHNWMQVWTTVNGLSEETFVTHLLDGASRERITLSEHPGSAGGFRSQYVVFDLVGRITERSNPTEINSGWAPSGDDSGGYIPSFQTYDWQSRPLVTTNQDGTTRSVSYSGCGCAGSNVITVTDEVGKIQQFFHDVQGRVVRTELRRPDTSLYATTTRSYNVRDQVLSTKHYQGSGDGASCPAGTCEDTLTEYDGYGRTWKRWLPKYQASTLDPNFTASTTPYDLYEYNDDDTLKKVTDPRTASVTYSYNHRGLVTGLTYGVPAGVASTPNVTFGYDQAGNRAWMEDGPGRVDYIYDSLNRLITEQRKFDEFGAPHEMLSAYNLAGQLTQLSDPAGAVIYYSFDKTGRLKTVTGTAFAGVTQYIGDVAYRAWNAAKQVSYDGAQTATLSYNNRMLVAQFGLNGVMASYSYRQDGRISGLTSSDAKLNRTFGYDDFGRISSSVGGGGPEPEQFTQSYGYDVFNNFTSRYGRYWWVNGNQSYTAGWVNGRMVSATENNTTLSTEYTKSGQMIRSYYLNQGSQVTKDGPFRYDAAGRVTGEGAVSASNPEQTMFYDGDGRLVKDLRNSTTTYSVRSSALGGEILTLLNASGQKSDTNVYAGGQLIATQKVSGYGNTVDQWRRDPHRTLSYSPGSASILDPMGVSVSPVTATQIQQYWNGQFQPPNGGYTPYGAGYNSPSNSNVRCAIDSLPVTCSYAMRQVNNGNAEIDQDKLFLPMGGVIGEGFALWGGFQSDGERGSYFSGSGVILGTAEAETQNSTSDQKKQPCDVVLPTDRTQLDLVYLLAHELTPADRVGMRQYQNGDTAGNRTGQIMTKDVLSLEAHAMASAVRNYASANDISVYDALHDSRYIQDGISKSAQGILDIGRDRVNDALQTENGSSLCERLRRAVTAAAYNGDNHSSGVRGSILPAGYMWWKAVPQGKRIRPQNLRGVIDIRFGDTDFTTYWGAPPRA
jgi:YD repeat-containing protein